MIRDDVKRLGPLVWCRQTNKTASSPPSGPSRGLTTQTNAREKLTHTVYTDRRKGKDIQSRIVTRTTWTRCGERERREERLSLPEGKDPRLKHLEYFPKSQGRERGPRTASGWAPEKTERRERTRRRNWGERGRDTHTNISRLAFLQCSGNQCDQLALCDRALTMATHWKTESEYENLKKHNFKSAVRRIGRCRESELKATHSLIFNFL